MNIRENETLKEQNQEKTANNEKDFLSQKDDVTYCNELDAEQKSSKKKSEGLTVKAKRQNNFFEILCGNYSSKCPSFDDRESKIIYTVKNFARSPLMIGASAMYSVTALLLMIPLIATLFPAFSMLASSFSSLMSSLSASSLMSLARALLGIAVVFIVGIPVFMKLFGLWYTVIQGFRKKDFDIMGLSSIRKSVIAITYIQVITTVVAFAVVLLMTTLWTGQEFKNVVSFGWLLRVFVPMAVSIVFAAVVSDMTRKGMDQAEYGNSKNSSSILMGVLCGVFSLACVFAMINTKSIVSAFESVENMGVAFKDILGPITEVIRIGGFWVFVPMLLSTMMFGALIFIHRDSLIRLRDEYFHD